MENIGGANTFTRITRRGVMRALSVLVPGSILGPSVVFGQEGIRRIVEGLPENMKTVDGVQIAISAQMSEFELRTIAQTINNFPGYTHYRFIVEQSDIAKNNLVQMLSEVKDKDILNRLSLDYVTGVIPWAQDAGKFFEVNGKTTFVTPNVKRPRGRTGMSSTDQRFINNVTSTREAMLGSSVELLEAPFYFEGGDVRVARNKKGEDFIFFGQSNVIGGIEQMRSLVGNEDKSDSDLFTQYKKLVVDFFGKNKVIFLPDDLPIHKPENMSMPTMYHLDQSILPLNGGNIAVATFPDIEQIERRVVGDRKKYYLQLRERQKKASEFLSLNNFEVFELPHDILEIDGHQYSLNGIVFENRGINTNEVIVPVFGNDLNPKGVAKAQDDIFEEDDFEEGRKTRILIKYLKKIGYRIHLVADPAAIFNAGSLNCKFNIEK